MANLVVARKKTKGRGGLIFLFVVVVVMFFGSKKTLPGEILVRCPFVFRKFGNEDGITGNHVLIWWCEPYM